jgi:phosphate transport system substrate-binding protein
LRSFIEDKLDFAFLTRDMSETDLQLYRRIHRRDPLVVPVAGGSYRHFGFVDTIVVIVNPKNPVDRISLRQLGAIFFAPGAGRTPPRYWSEIDRWGGGRPILVVGAAARRPIESARASFVRRRISQIEGRELTWRMDLPAAGREADIPAQVAADRDAIGFTGLGHLLPADKVLAISRSDGAPAIPPTYGNVAAGRYPLARTIDLVANVPASGRINPGLCSFVQFLLSRQGQQIVRDEGVFLPLSHVQVSRSRSLIKRYCAP